MQSPQRALTLESSAISLLEGRSGLRLIVVLLALLVLYTFAVIPLIASGTIDRFYDDLFVATIGVLSILIARPSGMWLALILLAFIGKLSWLLPTTIPSALLPIVSAVFNLAISIVLAKRTFATTRVTTRTILSAVIVYLTIAQAFTGLYLACGATFPGSFTNESMGASQFGQISYFSLVTLATVGFGDITPIHPIARSLATFEAILGQLYLTTMLARLVGLHISTRQQDRL